MAAAATVLPGSTTLNGLPAVIVQPGATISLSMVVQTSGLGTSNDWNASSWALGTSVPLPSAMDCVDHGNHNASGTFTEVFPITAPVTPGTYNLYLIAWNGNCQTDPSFIISVLPARVVVLADTTAPTVTINQAAAQADPDQRVDRSTSRSCSASRSPASRPAT